MRTFNELRHYGIKGQHWGVRRGPPYPLNPSNRAVGSLTRGNRSEEAERRVRMARNIALATLTGVAVVGAAYMAKKSGLFSKIRVSDLAGVASEVKFQKYEKGDRSARGIVFTPLHFQAAQNRYRDCLEKIDPIVFPDKGKSLLDNKMEAEEATLSISDAIGKRMRQSSESADLVAFAKAVSEGSVNADLTMTYHKIVKLIDDNHELMEKVLQTGRDFGDLKNKEAGEVLEIVKNLAVIYRDER